AGQMAESGSAGLGLAFVTYLSGDSLLRSTDDEEWAPLSPNLSLRTGDRVWAQDGAKIEVRFPLGATAWVNYQSELDVTRLERGSRVDTIQLALVSGEAAFDVKGFARTGSVFQVDIPNASIRASRAVRFRVNTLPDGTAQIGVVSGSLVLETPDGLTDVSGGHMAEIQPDQRVLLDFLPITDEWDSWVGSRAQLYDRPAASSRYLPDDLAPYAHEFDTSGRWVSDPTYGSIWVPAVEQGWSPYSNGRWVWQGNDYVWLGYDPWYAPFHYGRWSWGLSLGWFWIVPRGRAYWSPGYVGWSVVGDDVCWVPLGHDETYYGYGNYGPGTVNVFKTTTINITNVYINSRVNNGVVVVRRDDFLNGRIRHARLVPSRNPFEPGSAGVAKILARPPVKEVPPIRATRQSRPNTDIKWISVPPARIDKQSQTMKTRVVAPTKDKSVFKPGKKPAPLKNIVKEKQLQQWVPHQRVPGTEPGVVPAPAKRVQKGAAPAQPGPPAVPGRAAQPPAGKRQFKRVLEPQGGAVMDPPGAVGPGQRPQGQREDQPAEGRTKGGWRGGGAQ
ncbi:MAG TPA: FecR family protein, partial [Candidatus Methanoperedens sp.]|nr:FecR family protein [Candidatus Methanoperedens sp.]